jgi:hypothetical protein
VLEALSRYQVTLLAAAAAATVFWLLAASAIRFARRPSEPEFAAPTLELGPEPPALANLLARDFCVTPDAVPATLLDLAARGVVEIERLDVDTYQCRLRAMAGETHTAYERRVLELLRKRASDGIVPAQALTTGPAEEASRWWKAFVREVVSDSQNRGLSRDIWDRQTIVALALLAAVPTLLVGLALGLRGAAGYAAGTAFVLGGMSSRHRQRDTPAGLAAASRWASVRAALEQDEAFPAQPPIAVALWERLLAYGAALGVAAGAIRPIPMGAESDRRAWTSHSGRWRQVDIRYPRFVPPGWGLHPGAALFGALLVGGVAVFVLYLVASVVSSLGDMGRLGTLIVAALFVIPSAIVLGASVLAVRAVPDLWSTTEVTGEVLRLRVHGSDKQPRHYVAVDDGRSQTIRAWRVKPERYATLAQYEVVAASVTRRLGYVRSIAPMSAGQPPGNPAA